MEFIKNKSFVRRQMSLRTSQAKDDLKELRNEWYQLQIGLERSGNFLVRNRIQREWDKIQQENKTQFIKGRQEHKNKIHQIRESVRQRQKQLANFQLREDMDQVRECWLREMTGD